MAAPDSKEAGIALQKTEPARIDHVEAMDAVISMAKTATAKEQNMTLLQGVKLYPKAIMWSMLISTCIVMEGFDVALINNFCMR
jgi:MFS transporter, SP family, general alpha glucoside:H+ symporter